MTAPVEEAVLDSAGGLVGDVRRLMAAAATSDVPVADLDEAAALVRRAAQLLERSTRDHGIRRHLDRSAIARARAGEPWEVFGHNPLGIPLRISVDGATATAEVEPSALLEGPPGHLHGGFSAAMLDALLSTLVQVQGLRAVTVGLDVSFLRAVPLDAPLRLVGELGSREGRKIRAEGRLEQRGEVAVRAGALFVEVPGEPD